MVDHIHRRRLVAKKREHLHELHHVLGIVEVAAADVLDLHDDRVEAAQALQVELDMVRPGRQLRLAGAEDDLQVPPLTEDVIHPSPAGGVPAVLRAETTDPAAHQRPV